MVQWEPYFLNTSTPKEGYDLKQYLSNKYGDAAVARFSAPDNPLDKAGRQIGIIFNKNRRIINTTDGHRLMEWCKDTYPGKADLLMEKLFYAYFVEGKNLSETCELLLVCGEAGVPTDAAASLLESGLRDLYLSNIIN